MSGPDHGEVQRLTLGLGLAAARGDSDAISVVLAGVDPVTAGAVVVALAKVWVRAVDNVMELGGAADPRAETIALMQEQALEVAAQ
ncbi:hypothetical protein [Streptomyces sp. NPDC056500]|uniref:hypothetical protein n=1 Tax=unclassified Streptomyces TaxID=2593676 RepID=UPI00367C22EC